MHVFEPSAAQLLLVSIALTSNRCPALPIKLQPDWGCITLLPVIFVSLYPENACAS